MPRDFWQSTLTCLRHLNSLDTETTSYLSARFGIFSLDEKLLFLLILSWLNMPIITYMIGSSPKHCCFVPSCRAKPSLAKLPGRPLRCSTVHRPAVPTRCASPELLQHQPWRDAPAGHPSALHASMEPKVSPSSLQTNPLHFWKATKAPIVTGSFQYSSFNDQGLWVPALFCTLLHSKF